MAAGVTPGTRIAWPMVSGLHLVEALHDFGRQSRDGGVSKLPRDAPMLVARSPLNIGLLALQIALILHRRFDARNVEAAHRLLELESLADQRSQASTTVAAATARRKPRTARLLHRCRSESRKIPANRFSRA